MSKVLHLFFLEAFPNFTFICCLVNRPNPMVTLCVFYMNIYAVSRYGYDKQKCPIPKNLPSYFKTSLQPEFVILSVISFQFSFSTSLFPVSLVDLLQIYFSTSCTYCGKFQIISNEKKNRKIAFKL